MKCLFNFLTVGLFFIVSVDRQPVDAEDLDALFHRRIVFSLFQLIDNQLTQKILTLTNQESESKIMHAMVS
jgi:hypothetical protein